MITKHSSSIVVRWGHTGPDGARRVRHEKSNFPDNMKTSRGGQRGIEEARGGQRGSWGSWGGEEVVHKITCT